MENYTPELSKSKKELFDYIKKHNLSLLKDYSKDPIHGKTIGLLLLKINRERDKIQFEYPLNDLGKSRKNYLTIKIKKSIMKKMKKEKLEEAKSAKGLKEKTKKTNLKKYGVENPFSSKSIQDKIKQTNFEKYGVEWAMCSPEINIKMHNTMQERYGVKHALQKYTNIIDIDENKISHLRPCPHPDCNKCEEKTYSIKDTICFSRTQNGIELCTKLKPEYDFSQSSIEKWVTNLLKQNGIEYLTHYRLENKELDAFIPKKNIAFESNGCYWHSDVKKDKLYHHNKYKLCKNNNIQLFYK